MMFHHTPSKVDSYYINMEVLLAIKQWHYTPHMYFIALTVLRVWVPMG